MLTWIDIETTGLDPDLDAILELSVMITGDRLEMMAKRNYIIKPFNFTMSMAAAPDLVREMHEKSGLIQDVLDRGMSYEAVNADLCEWYKIHLAQGKSPMCGSSVHFDRGFLRRRFPDFEAMFHYRNIDISTIKELVTRWCPEKEWPGMGEDNPKRHRGLDDLSHTLAEARWYYEHLFFPTTTEG